MIEGRVNERLEAIISIGVFSVAGELLMVEAIVDTGFTEYLTLPDSIVRALGFDFKSTVVINLANGLSAIVAVGDATLRWNGVDQTASVFAAEGPPLIGMALLNRFDLHVEVVEGGRVTVTSRHPNALPE